MMSFKTIKLMETKDESEYSEFVFSLFFISVVLCFLSLLTCDYATLRNSNMCFLAKII